MHPIRIRLAQAGPLIRRPLGIAGQIHEMAVDPDATRARAALEFRLAEARVRLAHVHHLAVHR